MHGISSLCYNIRWIIKNENILEDKINKFCVICAKSYPVNKLFLCLRCKYLECAAIDITNISRFC